MKALLASTNEHKLSELRRALPGWEIRTPAGSSREPPAETGTTFLENARLKAGWGREAAAADEWALGEDSGIEVAALGGRPGVESARWAEDGVARLLAELAGATDRRALLRLLARRARAGRARGRRGRHHAGPGSGGAARAGRVRLRPDLRPRGSATVAELGNDWKTEHSHRARAAAALAQALAGS